ncbi:hypothetical protein BGX34_010031 [Mortierella sp. NVP85]|nr:hypothetical protein BGX34_010031 [Mortierella sp. NVP85]
MSKKLAAQALDTLLSGQSTGRISKRGSTSGPAKKIGSLPATKTGLKKIKHQLRYGHSVKRAQEAAAAKENPLDKLKTQLEKEQVIMEKNLSYYRTTNRISKKELELRSKIKKLREKGNQNKAMESRVEMDGEDSDQ